MSDARLDEFGDFLRSRRERLDPAAVGLGALRRRRTPGLRREEVAERAGIGVDWYVRLEQGRAVNPSGPTIDALARALCLNAAEHAHLRALAGTKPRGAFAREQVPEAIRRVVESLTVPAYVTGRRWDLLVWNRAADALFDFERITDTEPNILLYVFARPQARRLFGPGWEAEAQRMVAMFRATYDLWAGDPAFASLVAQLRSASPDFTRWWDAHDIRAGGVGVKHLEHPTRGGQRFSYATFQANDDPALKLAIYTPLPDSRDELGSGSTPCGGAAGED